MIRSRRLVSIFAALSEALFVAGAGAAEPRIPDWKIVHIDLGKRWIDFVFEPQRTCTRMVVCISLFRDEMGKAVEGDYVRYQGVQVKLFDRSGKDVKCERTWPKLEYFTPIEVGIGSHNGEYSLPAGVRPHLNRATLTFQGKTIQVSLQHMTRAD